MLVRLLLGKPSGNDDSEYYTSRDAFRARIGEETEKEANRKWRCNIDIPQADFPLIVQPARDEWTRLHRLVLGWIRVRYWLPLLQSMGTVAPMMEPPTTRPTAAKIHTPTK